jgi:hypothetical protein
VVVCAIAALAACGDTGQPAAPAAQGETTSAPAVATASDDGCSADNSPTDVVDTRGATPVIPVRADAATADTPLPDLVVRRINCAGGWVNLRNEVPADKPVLVWFWAPY